MDEQTPEETVAISPHALYFRDITLVTSYSCGPPDTREALDIVALGEVTARQVVTHRYPLEDAADAFATVAEAGESLKTLVVFGEPSSE